jgi:HK97 family phage prohead protease
MTNFPTKGEDKKISLRNSNRPQFDFEFASNVKEQTPEIWKAGGNIRGNEAFKLWERARGGDESPSVLEWIKEREAWIARHFEDGKDGKQFEGDTEPNLSNIGGVVAQMKWGTIGVLEEQGMKDVILEMTKKLEGKKEEKQLNETVTKALENKVKEHNEDVQDLDVDWNPRVTLNTLEQVMERGIGAYKTNPESVRPNVGSPEQWGYARVNSFLFALEKGRFQGGKHDTDLLPANHPVKKEMEEKKQVFIVMGASCSGKSTYVRNNANEKDLVFDFDTIHQAISTNPSHIHIDNIKRYVFDVRDAIYQRLKKDKTTNAWIINSSPLKQVRKQLVEELDARIIYIQRSKEECLRVAEQERPTEWKGYIENYFERFEGFDDDEEITFVNMEENKEVNLSEKRHIQKIEETEDSIIVYYGKSEKDVPMEDDMMEETPMEENEHVEGHDEEKETIYSRSNPNAEIRTFNVQDLELRQEGDENVVVGYGSVFNTLSNELGGFREIIAEGAFDGRLNDDVRFLINHDGLPLARTTNGTLKLTTDERGLKYEAKVANTSLGRDLIELMRNGTINQSSFAFVVEDDSWEVRDGVNVRTINKVSRLYDVSAVTYPAYEEASVALRSMEEWKKQEDEKVMKENLEKEKEEREKEEMDLTKRSLAELRLSIINKKSN